MAVAWLRHAEPLPCCAAPTRLVVLPFENLGAAGDAYLVDGIIGELIEQALRDTVASASSPAPARFNTATAGSALARSAGSSTCST